MRATGRSGPAPSAQLRRGPARRAIEAVYRKNRLPNYGVFDEVRYFEPGSGSLVIDVDGVPVGVTICEDVWEPGPPALDEAEAGARLIVNPSGSPYLRGKGADRERMFAERARAYGVPLAFCNLVGGQDELVFDGHSFVVDAGGGIVARAKQFEPDLLVWDLADGPGRIETPLGDHDEVYAALVLGVRDYARKNGFERALVGLSGGVDSALVAQIAADALGPDRLTCVVMPSPHSSAETQADARAIAANLGAECVELEIEPAMAAYEGDSERPLACRGSRGREHPGASSRQPADGALQRFGALVLATGNKSEMSVGYATLYGDMAGGLAVLKDVPKQLVYELVTHRNARDDAAIRAGIGALASPVGRAAPRSARRGLPAALRGAGPGPPGLRGARRGTRRPRDGRGFGRARERGHRPRRPRRVQAPPGAAGDPDHEQGVWARPTPADHQPVRWLMAARGIFVAPFDELADPRVIAELAASAESAGWDGFFVWDHVAYRAPTQAVADPWVALSAIACATERMRIGPLVTPLSRRRVHKVARETATLDLLSDGRLTLRRGLGSDNNGELEPFGEVVDPRERAQLLDEGLEALTGYWAGVFEPTPAQSPDPSVGRRSLAQAAPARACRALGRLLSDRAAGPRCARRGWPMAYASCAATSTATTSSSTCRPEPTRRRGRRRVRHGVSPSSVRPRRAKRSPQRSKI